jgi:dTDP-4-amino-4,6-dideoxygalactose transaminase
MGFKTTEFENKWKEYTGLNNAYFTNSATAALNLAVSTLKEKYGWNDGDEVITTPLTFVSTNHAVLLAGLHPVFADIDETFCLDPTDAEAKIGPRTRAIIFVGLGGNTGRYKEIVKICKNHGLKLILDSAHMAGTTLDGEVPGKEADAVIYSFQAVKNLPTGDAGMLCMADSDCDQVARKKGWLGINKDTYIRSTESLGRYKWRYDVEYLGEKYNGNSIMAAVALAQLPHLMEDNKYRKDLVERYKADLSDINAYIRFPRFYDECTSSWHLFQILVPNRDGLIDYLNSKDIYPGVHYVPNTEYSMYSYARGTCSHADFVGRHVVSLPLHLRLTKEDVKYVAACIKEFILHVNNRSMLNVPADWLRTGI